MIVIVRNYNYITIHKFRYKFVRYWLCVMVNKLKGFQVEVLEDDGI